MKKTDIQKLGKEDLEEKLRELQRQLIKERAQVARGIQVKNPYIIKNTRKAIARILQLLRQKEVTQKA
ncbi:MAG: 50S ribosomal protein L29 [Candidatus Woesearchaeota archaeon]|jgi:ribosomal protein L29